MTQQFLNDFQTKMDTLADIRRQLQGSIQKREEFTNQLKTQLTDVNSKMRQLAGLINDLQNKANDLQKQVGQHTTSIGDKERQIAEFNEKIANATGERDRVTQEFNEYRDKTESKINEQQSKINQFEEQLRQITEQLRLATEQKESAENQARALQANMQASGDQKDKEHALAIEQLTQENQQQLQQQQQQLTQRIEEADRKVAELEEQLRQKTEEHQQTRQQLDENQNQVQGQVANLQKEIDRLTQENQQLINRIIAATDAINQANEELQLMTGSIEGAQNKQEIEALLNDITEQLDQSIQNISRSMQGQSPMPPRMPAMDTNTQLQIQGRKISYGELITGLQRKASQLQRQGLPDQQNKYAIVINALRGLNNPNSANIELLLQSNSITIKENGVFGGKRKTKKNRKQKGGFTYKISSKRRGITSKSSRRSTRSNSRRSSR